MPIPAEDVFTSFVVVTPNTTVKNVLKQLPTQRNDRETSPAANDKSVQRSNPPGALEPDRCRPAQAGQDNGPRRLA